MKIFLMLISIILISSASDTSVFSFELKEPLIDYKLKSIQKFGAATEALYLHEKNYKVITLNNKGIYTDTDLEVSYKVFLDCLESKDKCSEKYGMSFLALENRYEEIKLSQRVSVKIFSLEDFIFNAFIFINNNLKGSISFSTLYQKNKKPAEFTLKEVIGIVKQLHMK